MAVVGNDTTEYLTELWIRNAIHHPILYAPRSKRMMLQFGVLDLLRVVSFLITLL